MELRISPISEAARNLGRPQRVSLAATVGRESLLEVGRRLWERMDGPEKVHIVAVANGGILIASCAFLKAECLPRLSSFTIIKPNYGFDVAALQVANGERVYLVDNSIHTGRTARNALQSVSSRFRVSGFIKLLDYQDDLERSVVTEIVTSTGIPVLSLFALDELIDRTNATSSGA